jgi:hypothetical protein
VVIDDFDRKGLSVFPFEADPPLVIYPDTVLTLSVSFKFLQTVPRGQPEIFNRVRGVKKKQFSEGQPMELRGEPPRSLSIEDCLGDRVLEAADHKIMIMRGVNNVKRYVGALRSELSGPSCEEREDCSKVRGTSYRIDH